MEIFKEIQSLKAFLSQKGNSISIGLVPTMGALHAGHLSLIEASKRENQLTVCSIFVNPAQFNNPKDLEKYPRTLERDLGMLEKAGCDIVFAPEAKMMYDTEPTIKFDFGDLDKILEGKFRPGHFSGVALVVSKFFNIVKPTVAYFGQKDAQQVAIIKRLTRDLGFEMEIVELPTIREESGLALSSRNRLLSEEDRDKASIILKALKDAKLAFKNGERNAGKLTEIVQQAIAGEPLARIDYIAVVDRETLQPVEKVGDIETIIAAAVFFGDIRLIDNTVLNRKQ
jgi:pantoate--beta-alanine ligase